MLISSAALVAAAAPVSAETPSAPGVADATDLTRNEIVVTASPIGVSQQDTIIGAQVISAEDLQRRIENTIGETLKREPGVSSTFFGPGASRPIIRGQGGERVAVLDAGIGSLDVSATSPDHAVAVEPATAQRIEIVRGASTLLYGSSAAGGVVNVTSGRIPQAVPENDVSGTLRVGGSTVDAGVNAAGGFDATVAKVGDGAIVFHGEGAYRKADDYKIPGFEQSTRLREQLIADGEQPDGARGVERNSNLTSDSGSVGASYIAGDSFVGVSASAIQSSYGVPGVETEADGSGPSIELRQRRIDFNSEVNKDFLIFKAARVRFGYANYRHQELEADGSPSTLFKTRGWEQRIELVQQKFGPLSGAIGAQIRMRDFNATGNEVFLSPTKTSEWGVFSVQQVALGDWRLEGGARFERSRHDNDLGGVREFNAVSLSAGVGYKPNDQWFFGVNGMRTERAPAPEELFANGPHLATGNFEVGDPTLGLEIARGVEGTAKFTGGRVALTINGYYTSYKNFVFERTTGATVLFDGEDLPETRFTASDATFKGTEAQIEAELVRIKGFDIHGDASVDYVRATAAASGTGDVPRIPPLHSIAGLDAKSERLDFRAEVERAGRQFRIGDRELPTDSYVLYNAYVTWRPISTVEGLAVRLSGENLTNEEARPSTSFLKDLVPEPGRNVKVELTANF